MLGLAPPGGDLRQAWRDVTGVCPAPDTALACSFLPGLAGCGSVAVCRCGRPAALSANDIAELRDVSRLRQRCRLGPACHRPAMRGVSRLDLQAAACGCRFILGFTGVAGLPLSICCYTLIKGQADGEQERSQARDYQNHLQVS